MLIGSDEKGDNASQVKRSATGSTNSQENYTKSERTHALRSHESRTNIPAEVKASKSQAT